MMVDKGDEIIFVNPLEIEPEEKLSQLELDKSHILGSGMRKILEETKTALNLAF
jgi:hypothetical protein